MSFDTKIYLKTLTSLPGVYCMQDAQGQVIYVGKAKNLKKRVSSYFASSKTDSPKTQVMIKQVANIEVTVTHTENEALILENNLIKSYKPRYNVLFRDDKSYPYLYLSSEHEYPHFRYHRGALKGKGKYFGPYPGAGSVKRTLNLLQKLFLIRSCEDSVFANRSRPCLQYQIKRCSAPCVEIVSKEDYTRDIRHATLFLEGKNDEVIKSLNEPMQKASEALEFEVAARLRDQIRSLRDVQEKQHISTDGGDLDIIACVIDGSYACIQLVIIRSGLNLGSRSYYLQNIAKQPESELVSAFLSQFYLSPNTQQKIATEILISHEVDDLELIEEVISEKAGRKIKLKFKVRAERAKWLSMTQENANLALKHKLARNKSQRKRFKALEELLSFTDPIERMECFDISHTQGESTVGSCVVFGTEGPINSQYRQFNIKNITKGDDYAAMSQVVRRRYTRLIKEEAKLPDIILIDGGKGQISVAKKELDELQILHIPILGVAKGTTRKPGLENLILALEKKTVDCDSSSPALHLIQHIRDEAHRFAITAHRQRRKKTRNSSTLEDIEGIGNKRRQSLIKHFGGMQGIAKAGIDDLANVQGINKNLAQKIYENFHNIL